MLEYKKAAALSYTGIVLYNAIGLFLTPFIVRMLGKADYGLYSLIGSFVAYLTLLDLGINGTVIRYIAQYRAQKDLKGEQNFIANIFIVYLFIAFLIALFGFILYLNTNTLFSDSLTTEELEKAKIMILILILNFLIGIPGKAFEGISMGYEKFVFPRIISISKYISRAILVVVILTHGADSLGMVILDTVINIFFIGVSMYYVFIVLKVFPKLQSFKFTFIKELFRYSIWVFIFSFVFQFQWSTGQVVLGMFENTEAVAIFAIGVTLGMYYIQFGGVLNSLLLPKVVRSIYNKISIEEQNSQLVRVSRLSLFVLAYILLAFILFGKEFIYLWVGAGYEKAWIVAVLVMVSYTLPISQGYIHAILEAKKMLKFKALSLLVFGTLGIVSGAMLSINYGLVGMISGIASFLILLHIFLNFYYNKVLGFKIRSYFVNTYLKILPGLVAIYLIIFLMDQFFDTRGWITISIQIMIYSMLFIVVFYLTILNHTEKEIVKSNLNL